MTVIVARGSRPAAGGGRWVRVSRRSRHAYVQRGVAAIDRTRADRRWTAGRRTSAHGVDGPGAVRHENGRSKPSFDGGRPYVACSADDQASTASSTSRIDTRPVMRPSSPRIATCRYPGVDHQTADRGDRLRGRRGDQVDRHDGPHLLAFEVTARRDDGDDVPLGDHADRPDRAAHQEHADLVCGQLLGHLAQRFVLFDRDRLVLHDPADRLLGRCRIQRVTHRGSSRCHRTPRELPGTRRSTGVVEPSPRHIRLAHREWSVANHGCSRAARPDGAVPDGPSPPARSAAGTRGRPPPGETSRNARGWYGGGRSFPGSA